jgi:hypothetical protein
MASVAPVFAARLIPGESSTKIHFTCLNSLAISVSALLYDHSLSFGGEMDLIWFNSEAAFGNRIGFILNRYLTEAVAIYVAYCKCFIHPHRVLYSISSQVNSGLYQGLTSEVSNRLPHSIGCS